LRWSGRRGRLLQKPVRAVGGSDTPAKDEPEEVCVCRGAEASFRLSLSLKRSGNVGARRGPRNVVLSGGGLFVSAGHRGDQVAVEGPLTGAGGRAQPPPGIGTALPSRSAAARRESLRREETLSTWLMLRARSQG
jgi:hypothetical protein